MQLKFIYWFAYYHLDSPSVRYRAQYPLAYLKKEYGIDSFFVMPSYKWHWIMKFLNAYLHAMLFRKANSIIVVQRVHSNFIYANLLKLLIRIRNKNTFYDTDDADYLEYPDKSIFYFVKHTEKIIVGSQELVKNLSRLNSNIFINTSPAPCFDISKKQKNELFTVGWIGGFGGGHKESLINLLFPAIKTLPFKIKLVILGVADKIEYDFLQTYFAAYNHVQLVIPMAINWNDEVNVQSYIVTFDVGIATLIDDELFRSKSAFKTKQYMNNGIPVLSSNIAENNAFVNHGENGFLCNNPEDFRQRIIEINAMNAIEYKHISNNALQTRKHFSIQNYCDQLIAECQNS
jgi:glycosyltransferase involved in cell wall biosynthesis